MNVLLLIQKLTTQTKGETGKNAIRNNSIIWQLFTSEFISTEFVFLTFIIIIVIVVGVCLIWWFVFFWTSSVRKIASLSKGKSVFEEPKKKRSSFNFIFIFSIVPYDGLVLVERERERTKELLKKFLFQEWMGKEST